MISGHGGNIHEIAGRLRCLPADIIDMSSNVNPLGPPDGFLDFLTENLHMITSLPEANAGTINHDFAAYYGLQTDTVLAGNGTTQFIYLLPKVLNSRKVLIVGPTYADYADSCRMHGIPFEFFMTTAAEKFQVDFNKLESKLVEVDTVFICNPNNPTGTLIPVQSLENLIIRHPDVFFVVDESYLPFVPDHNRLSLLNNQSDNLVVLNSMSKIFGIPGLRIGFVIASQKIIQKILAYYLPWSVNSLAQAAVSCLMNHKEIVDKFIQVSQTYLEVERTRFLQNFACTSRILFFPGPTSFILGKLSGINAHEVCERLAGERILIRNCDNFEGLSHRYIRISLKTSDINRMAAEKLLQVIMSL
jgi:threonine-phosphate decarboxylase